MFLVSLIITFVGIIFNKNIAMILGANEVLLESVSIYIKTLAIFSIPMSLMFLFGFVDRVIEKPELYLKGSIISVMTNIILNYILIKTTTGYKRSSYRYRNVFFDGTYNNNITFIK